MRAIKFKCSVDQANRSFYRAANNIFARVGRLASEEVMDGATSETEMPTDPAICPRTL